MQLLLLCGHNATLAQRLHALKPTAAHRVLGFTTDVRRHLMVGDFFIGKPGPGSLSEALQQGLPVLTVRNAWTMPQERYNTDWVLAMGVGVVGASWRRVRPLVDELLATLAQCRAAVAQIDNRAVFELPHILEDILAFAQALARGVTQTRSVGKATREVIAKSALAEALAGTGEDLPRHALDAQGCYRRLATGWGALGQADDDHHHQQL